MQVNFDYFLGFWWSQKTYDSLQGLVYVPLRLSLSPCLFLSFSTQHKSGLGENESLFLFCRHWQVKDEINTAEKNKEHIFQRGFIYYQPFILFYIYFFLWMNSLWSYTNKEFPNFLTIIIVYVRVWSVAPKVLNKFFIPSFFFFFLLIKERNDLQFYINEFKQITTIKHPMSSSQVEGLK